LSDTAKLVNSQPNASGPVKKVIVSVVNDLVTDQRVDKVCTTLTGMGFDVKLVGRRKKDSPPLPSRKYNLERMHLLFEKGPLFYAEFNLRLFFFLLSEKADLLVSNDLDTLLPNFLTHKLKRIPIVYDSHELFTETPEVIHRPFVKSVWEFIERTIFPKLKDIFTVSDSIAEIFKIKYNVEVKVVRNVPKASKFKKQRNRKDLDLPDDKKILILQGSGINIQRGAEELVEAMQYLEGYLLLIVGGGDVIDKLKQMTETLNLYEKIRFISRQSPENLYQYTMNADLGLAVDKDSNLNYRYALPNKLFDYIHAGIPVLVSPLVEIKKIVEKYNIGTFIENHEPKSMARKIDKIFSDEAQLNHWKDNLKLAADDLCWENEEEIIKNVYLKYV